MKIIGLCGLPGSGKSTVATILCRSYCREYPCCVSHKELSSILLDNVIKELFFDNDVTLFDFKCACKHEKYGDSVRSFLQDLGSRMKKDDPLILAAKIRDYSSKCKENGVVEVIIYSGVRDQCEVEAITDSGGRVFNIVSPWRKNMPTDNHEVESHKLVGTTEVINHENDIENTCSVIMEYMSVNHGG